MEITIRVIALCTIEPREDDLLNLIRILRVCMGKSRSSTNFRRRRLITKTVRFNTFAVLAGKYHDTYNLNT